MLFPKRFLTATIVLCVLFIAARAQNRFDSWTTADGLPQDAVLSLARTGDGYLWLGTYEGLARFDGVDFTVFNNGNTEAFKSNYVMALLEDRRGDLWIGLDGGGLVRRAGGEFTRYSTADGLLSDSVVSLFEDERGNLWIGTDRGGLNVLRDGKISGHTVADGLPDNHIWSLAEDDAGNLWVGTSKGLSRYQNGQFTNYFMRDGLSSDNIQSLQWSAEDGLWIGTGKGLTRLKNEKFEIVAADRIIGESFIFKLFVERNGDLLISTNLNGFFRRRRQDAIEKVPLGINDNNVRSIHQDEDGSEWFGTYSRGLLHWQTKRFENANENANFGELDVRGVYQDRNGAIWFASGATLYQFQNGFFKTFEFPETGISYIKSIYADADGNLWIGGAGGIAEYDGQKFSLLTTKDGLSQNDVSAVFGDRSGSVWAGTTENGLNRWRDGRFTVYKTDNGLAGNFVMSFYEDRAGAVWVGTSGGITRFVGEQLTTFRLGEGVASNAVNAFYEDAAGVLWIGTSGGGLFRLKDGEFKKITTADGLYDNLTFSILEAGGDLWMCGNRGAYRAALDELNAVADGRKSFINSYNYDAADGMPSRECNGNFPGGWQMRDGTIYFATVKGLTRINPQTQNSVPPTVLIERVTVDGEPQPNLENFSIPAGKNNLEIKYTALSWQRPRQIKFKYRLAGLSGEWTEAANRRTAYFPYLPPGDYVFEVIADNGEGVWNESGEKIQIKMLPPFYRTWWFFGLGWLGLGWLIYLIYRRRVRQFEMKQAQQEEFSRRLINAHETERRRIAGELHDSIGQSLAMIKNRAVLGAESATDENAKKQLALITAQTAQTIGEVREISYNLRPYLLDNLGLTKTIKSLLNKISETSRFKIKTEIDEVDDLFDKEAEMSIYRIVQESLSNVIKHAAATEVKVMLKKGGRSLSIVIADDGRGFDASKSPNGEPGKGGFGLLGIAERVRYLGGTQEIETEIGAGTTVFIRIPLRKSKINADGQAV